MSDKKHSEGGNPDDLHDVFEVMDVVVKEEATESSDQDIVILEDITSLPEPSQPLAQDDQPNLSINDANASFSQAQNNQPMAQDDQPNLSINDSNASFSQAQNNQPNLLATDVTANVGPSSLANDVTASFQPSVQGNNISQSASFRCQKCGKTFCDLRRLKRHDRDVHALVRIQCEICNYSSARKDHLQRHYQCWHKERWTPSLSWWKRVTQKNKARAKGQFWPDVSRRGNGGSSGNMISRPEGMKRGNAGSYGSVQPRQRFSGVLRTSVHPIASRERSVGGHVPTFAPSTISTAAEPDVPTLWSSLPPVSATGSPDGSHVAQVSMARSPNHTPPISISSVVSLLQPPATSSPPQASSMALRPIQHDSSIHQSGSKSPVSPLNARSSASAGSSPQIVSLLQNASSTRSSGAAGMASGISQSGSSNFSQTMTAPSALPSAISPRSKHCSPVTTTSISSQQNIRPATSVASAPMASSQTAQPAMSGGNSSQIFSLLRTSSSSSGTGAGSTVAGGPSRIGPRNAPKPSSIGKVQAQVNQKQNTVGSTTHSQPSTISGGRSTGNMGNTPTKWATVEEKKTVRYFVDGRLIRQEEERVQSYKKIPAHWDMGIDVRDNFPTS